MLIITIILNLITIIFTFFSLNKIKGVNKIYRDLFEKHALIRNEQEECYRRANIFYKIAIVLWLISFISNSITFYIFMYCNY